MRESDDARMWRNLGKGVAWIAAGAVAILAVEMMWDHLAGREYARAGDGAPSVFRERETGAGIADLADIAFGDAAPGGEVPEGFAEECFDPRILGEVSVSADGAVMGIVSELPSAELFDRCSDGLEAHGWVALESGLPLRCTFSKGVGRTRWLFLDVSQVSGSGVAVIVLENRR